MSIRFWRQMDFFVPAEIGRRHQTLKNNPIRSIFDEAGFPGLRKHAEVGAITINRLAT
jgi:hypothetical protein